MTRPRISVCLPNYNKAKFLPKRIESIRAQTFAEYEVVAADSFSTDGSHDMLRAYAVNDPRVLLFQVPRGLYASWNFCIRAARSEWLYFACSDDTMAFDCLEQLFSAAERTGADVVTSRPWMIDADGHDLPIKWERIARCLLQRRLTAGFLDPVAEFRAGLVVGTPTNSITQMLISRRAFERIGEFPTNCGASGDYVWQMRALRSCRFYYLPRKLGSWRRYSEQATVADGATLLRDRANHALKFYQSASCPSDKRSLAALGFCVGRGGGAFEGLPDISASWAKATNRLGGILHPYLFALMMRGISAVQSSAPSQ